MSETATTRAPSATPKGGGVVAGIVGFAVGRLVRAGAAVAHENSSANGEPPRPALMSASADR